MKRENSLPPSRQADSDVKSLPIKNERKKDVGNRLKMVDQRVRNLLENCVELRNRSFFVIVGDRARFQISNIHWAVSKVLTNTSSVAAGRIDMHKRVLWCFSEKGQLGFSSSYKTRNKEKTKRSKKGRYDDVMESPFEAFLSTVKIRYVKYKDTESILGQTFGMCVLQDFEAITPNILCRAMETIHGGGIVCILLSTMSSLKQLYYLTMDAHKKYRNDAIHNYKPRFNERCILSLQSCDSCLVVDDELNILPISSSAPLTQKINQDNPFINADAHKRECELNSIKQLEAKNAQPPLSYLIKLAVTSDQAKVIKTFSELLAQKKLDCTVSLTAARGRGKSAALGLAIAAALIDGFSNIFLTAPSPQNVGTVFEFIQKGIEACGLVEHNDFQLIQDSTASQHDTPSSAKHSIAAELRRSAMDGSAKDPHQSQKKEKRNIIRINIFHQKKRQTIQFVYPHDYKFVHHQAELLVIDEAAAIPLPIVKHLIGHYMVFMSSTVNGYEGTGRALSLKLIEDLRRSSLSTGKDINNVAIQSGSRCLVEMTLEEPIRYAENDALERWLSSLLCLDATQPFKIDASIPLAIPKKCSLYSVDRDALFSFHKASESFLHNIMSLFVSSHYKNTPNDLLLLSDAPSHYIFVLLPYVPSDGGQDCEENNGHVDKLPDVYCAIHVALEGALNRQTVRESLNRGYSPSGDLLPWTLSKYFSDEDFTSLTGARIVRIATHPSLQRMGYATEAVRQLAAYFGQSTLPSAIGHMKMTNNEQTVSDINIDSSTLHSETLLPRETPPLLSKCSNRSTVFEFPVDYIGSSFGLTTNLYRFWRMSGFLPVYLRQFTNDITGEHSVIVIRPTTLTKQNGVEVTHKMSDWCNSIVEDEPQAFDPLPFVNDFRSRFLKTLGGPFRHLDPKLVLSVLDPSIARSFTNENETPHCSNIRTLDTGSDKQQLTEDIKLSSIDSHMLPITAESILSVFSRHDFYRLEKYSKQLVDYTLITDLLPQLVTLSIQGRLPNVTLTYLQCAVMIAIGLQGRSVEETATLFQLSVSHLFSLFNKAAFRIHLGVQELLERREAKEMDKEEAQREEHRYVIAKQKHGAHLLLSSTTENALQISENDGSEGCDGNESETTAATNELDEKRKRLLDELSVKSESFRSKPKKTKFRNLANRRRKSENSI